MKTLFFISLFCAHFCVSKAQTYSDSIYTHRENYKKEFLEDNRSPLKTGDTSYLRFYKPDIYYRVMAALKLTPESAPFQISTHNGKAKTYKKYGDLSFTLHEKRCTLEVYQSLDLLKQEKYKSYLFVPFNDLTNYETTYAGGRYIDLSIKDILNNTIALDFNKCYNPYCAFASGYSCPIPPDANKLKIRIEAGEKLFGKEVKE